MPIDGTPLVSYKEATVIWGDWAVASLHLSLLFNKSNKCNNEHAESKKLFPCNHCNHPLIMGAARIIYPRIRGKYRLPCEGNALVPKEPTLFYQNNHKLSIKGAHLLPPIWWWVNALFDKLGFVSTIAIYSSCLLSSYITTDIHSPFIVFINRSLYPTLRNPSASCNLQLASFVI